MKIFWTKEALLRLQEIEEYISRDNPVAVIEFVDKLISAAETLIDNPKKGRVVPELSLSRTAARSQSQSSSDDISGRRIKNQIRNPKSETQN